MMIYGIETYRKDFWIMEENLGKSGKNLIPPFFGPFWSKLAPLWPKNSIIAYLLNDLLNFADFWYRNYSYGLLWEN